MLFKKILIFIISIIILIEIYIQFCVSLEVESSNFTNIELENTKEIIIVNKEPWVKIKESKNINNYYINIINFDEVKFLEWKDLIPDLEYNITNKILKIPSKDEERAMSIANLLISNMKNDIEINEIIKNDLINKSIKKSRNFNVVFTKIKNLVIENNKDTSFSTLIDNSQRLDLNNEINNIKDNNIKDNNIKDNNIKDNNIKDNNIKNNKIKSIKPEEYNYDGFNNSHNELFKKDKLVRNNLSSGAYMGKQYARPFRY